MIYHLFMLLHILSQHAISLHGNDSQRPMAFNPVQRASSSSLHLITETVDVNGNGRRFTYRSRLQIFQKSFSLENTSFGCSARK